MDKTTLDSKLRFTEGHISKGDEKLLRELAKAIEGGTTETYKVSPLHIIVGAGLAGIASIASQGCATIMPKTATIDDLIAVSYPQSTPQDQVGPFLSETRTAYNTLINFLSVPRRKVHIYVSDIGRSHVDRFSGYVINYSSSLMSRKAHPPIWHELTHSLTQSSGEFYPEGLAEYIKMRFGNRRDKDTHSWVNRKFKEYNQIVSVSEIFHERIGALEWSGPRIRKEVNYSVAASFVRYLVEDALNGDIKKFMEFFMAEDYSDATHKKFFGKTLKQLDSAWIEMLSHYGDKPKIFKSY